MSQYERVRGALQSLTDAVAHMRVPQTLADAALQVTVTIGPALKHAQEILADTPPTISNDHDYECVRCHLQYTPKEGESEDCPACGCDGTLP